MISNPAVHFSATQTRACSLDGGRQGLVSAEGRFTRREDACKLLANGELWVFREAGSRCLVRSRPEITLAGVYNGLAVLSNIRPIKIPSEETAVGLLLGCHLRIRQFTATAARIAAAEEAPTEQVAQAAESVLRYFTVALPLHEADENESVDPRLRACAPPEIAQESQEMVAQHRRINEVLRQLVPMWTRLASHPEKLPEMAPRMGELVSELQQLWEVHLTLEEQTVFPAIERCLSRQQLDEIFAEMKARRS